ncbi:MAG: endonuclease [Solirubrobacteraceae bacterium]|nr:endonuclease [Solirubrobacteraceae bacterium]
MGERAAVSWLWRAGAYVFIPFDHSPDFDLIAVFDAVAYRVEVKTSTHLARNSSHRYQVQLATGGGNRSWDGIMKLFDPARCDFVFVLVSDGRRWLIPTSAISSKRSIMVGGPRCGEFEVDDIDAPSDAARLLEWAPPLRGDSRAVKGAAL